MKLLFAITFCCFVQIGLAQPVSISNIDGPFHRIAYSQLDDFIDSTENRIWDYFVINDASLSFLIGSVFVQYKIKKNGPEDFSIYGLKYLEVNNQDEKVQHPVFELSLKVVSSRAFLTYNNEFDGFPKYSSQKIESIIKKRNLFISSTEYTSIDYETINDSVVESILLLEEELFMAALNGSETCREYHRTLKDDFFVLNMGYSIGLYKSNEEILSFKFENIIPDSRKKTKHN